MKRLVTTILFVVSSVLNSAAAAEAAEAVVNAVSGRPFEKLDQACSLVDTTNVSTAENLSEVLIEWLRAQGGRLSPKVEFQRLDNEDPSSPLGLFAVEAIQMNETLIVVPEGCLLTTGDTETGDDMCDLTLKLVEQYKLQDKSYFAPYIEYLFSDKARNLPSAWSPNGTSLLKTIIGKQLEPQDVDGLTFQRECMESASILEEEELLYEEAWRLVVSNGWTNVMVPVLDMIQHRNGRWRNVDLKTLNGNALLVALREIEAGEQLHVSYNECAGCDGMAHTYVTPNVLRDHGFVESYPRRFNFMTLEGELGFEVYQSAPEELQVAWFRGKPHIYHLNWLRGHVKRLHNLYDYVWEQLELLSSKHEKDVIAEYYQALTTALEQAVLNATQQGEDECSLEPGDPCTVHRQYDALEDRPDTLDYQVKFCDCDWHPHREFYPIDEIQSHYQAIKFVRSNDTLDDTCLYLSDGLHSCTSFRPHYHEALVHYPARFVKEVKRIIFIGGGDNMVLHEILKYPTLELVVGLELDQQVVRSSFKNMGIQPHFDNDKVQWWFGDAAKSLQMLPKEYYGTFDLVLVDLETYVRDSLMVTKELSLMDAALLLVHPNGVIAQNDDLVARSNEDFAKYTVDLEYHDVPEICQQSITIGSNTVDFFNTAPKDHKIDNLYLDSGGDHFDGWWNYRTNTLRERAHCTDTYKNDSTTKDVMSRHGVLMILESEDTDVPLDSTSSVRAIVSEALQKAGLTEISFGYSQDKVTRGVYTMLFIMREGYVVVRAWPEHKYCGFDLLLWSSFDRQETAKTQLIASVGSNVGRSSSYRILTGGMYGIEQEETKVGPNATVLCENNFDDDLVPRVVPFEKNATDAVLQQMILLIQATDPVIAVFCADQSSPCTSLEILAKDASVKEVIPVWTCSSVAAHGSDDMPACEKETRSFLEESTRNVGKLDGIILDPATPRAMGQIMHKMLNNTRVRKELLQDEYVVLVATTQDTTESSWRRSLLERFRTDFAQFSPAYRAEILFKSNISSLEVGVFSTGDFDFYSCLNDAITSIKKATGIAAQVRKVADGIINYVADVEPSATFKDSDYDHSAARDQWHSQHPLGQQTILQFEIQAPKSQIFPADKVLFNLKPQLLWSGRWYPGSVVSENDDGTYNVIYEKGGEVGMPRDLILKIETDIQALPIDIGERVLIRQDDCWMPGVVNEPGMDGKTYKVHRFDNGGGMPSEVPRCDLIRQVEPTDVELPKLSTDILKKSFHIALVESGIVVGIDEVLVYSDMADGCLVVAFWHAGNAIASWDGRTHIDVNLYTTEDNAVLRNDFASNFQASVPHLSMISRDEQPRGVGRVVNFKRELDEYKGDEAPHWISL